jgi:hypothetical protein
MQQLNFGRLECLHVIGGEPSFSPAPRLVQDIKIGTAESIPRSEIGREDFVLRSSVIELFSHLERLGAGVVSAIEIRYGLPARLILERTVEEFVQ